MILNIGKNTAASVVLIYIGYVLGQFVRGKLNSSNDDLVFLSLISLPLSVVMLSLMAVGHKLRATAKEKELELIRYIHERSEAHQREQANDTQD